jgi:hypothetical protein
MSSSELIISVFSPFISAFLVYYFGIKGKRKETELQKEHELNNILSNLLLVWHFLTRIEIVIEILKDKKSNSIVPKRFFPVIVFKTGFLNDNCFLDLDKSIDVLKKYDPILFYKLEGIGNSFDTMRKKFILPLISNSENDTVQQTNAAETLNIEILTDVEKYLKIVAKKIGLNTFMKVRKYINEHLSGSNENFMEEINQYFYEIIIQMIPDELGPKPSYEDFVKQLSTDEYKDLIESQLELLLNNGFENLNVLIENQNISIEEFQSLLNNKNNGST